MSNFPWVAPSPILGQTIDRCLNFGYEKLADWYELANFVKNCNDRLNSFGTLTFAVPRPFSANCLITLPKWRCCFPSKKAVLFKEGFKESRYLWLPFSLVFFNNGTLVFKCQWQCFDDVFQTIYFKSFHFHHRSGTYLTNSKFAYNLFPVGLIRSIGRAMGQVMVWFPVKPEFLSDVFQPLQLFFPVWRSHSTPATPNYTNYTKLHQLHQTAVNTPHYTKLHQLHQTCTHKTTVTTPTTPNYTSYTCNCWKIWWVTLKLIDGDNNIQLSAWKQS